MKGTMTAILLAGGSGTRFGGKINKVYLRLEGKTVLEHSLDTLLEHPSVSRVVIVYRPEDEARLRRILKKHAAAAGRIRTAVGGTTRQESVREGLKGADTPYVLIQDAARPRIRKRYITACRKALKEGCAGVSIAVRSKDTVKVADENGIVQETTPRERTWLIQTPQAFRTDVLKAAQAESGTDGGATDDCVLLEKAGQSVRLLEGDYANIKLTTRDDWKRL